MNRVLQKNKPHLIFLTDEDIFLALKLFSRVNDYEKAKIMNRNQSRNTKKKNSKISTWQTKF